MSLEQKAPASRHVFLEPRNVLKTWPLAIKVSAALVIALVWWAASWTMGMEGTQSFIIPRILSSTQPPVFDESARPRALQSTPPDSDMSERFLSAFNTTQQFVVVISSADEEAAHFEEIVLTRQTLIFSPLPGAGKFRLRHDGLNIDMDIDTAFGPIALHMLAPQFEKVVLLSVVGLDAEFLNALFSLDKRYLGVSLDMSMLFDSVTELKRNTAFEPFIPLVDVKVPNEATRRLYAAFDFKSAAVLPMPGYKSSEYTQSVPATLTVGCFGPVLGQKALSTLSGLARIVDVVVFQHRKRNNALPEHVRQEVYTGIKELNELLAKLKPSVLIVALSLFEPHYFTLSLAMATKLPIIIKDGPAENSIANMAADYDKLYKHDFGDSGALLAVARSHKQDWFTTIHLDVDFPVQWKWLLKPSVHNVVLVTSKIVVSSAPLHYTKSRSRFGPQQRFEQTLETLVSIRARIPNSFIVLVDNSKLDETWLTSLTALTDLLLLELPPEMSYYTDVTSMKHLGECVMTDFALQAVDERQLVFKNLFKLTGRYTLNDEFNYEVFENSDNIFKKAVVGPAAQLPYYSYTSFYNIHHSRYENYRSVLRDIIDSLKVIDKMKMPPTIFDDFESRFSVALSSVRYVTHLGVTQRVAPFDVKDVNI